MAELNQVQFASDLPKQSKINIGTGALYRLAKSGQPTRANNYVSGPDAVAARQNMNKVRRALGRDMDLGSMRPTGRASGVHNQKY